MPPKRYADRALTLYFPSVEYKNEWSEEALKAKMPLSTWIFSMVDAKLSEAAKPRPDLHREIDANREELANLRRAIREKDAALEKYETELYTLRHRGYLSYGMGPGKGIWDAELIHLLQSGKVWRSSDLLQALGIDPKNSEAMAILANQLRALQDMGLVAEDPQGWRWL
jgi:hypothetical protein